MQTILFAQRKHLFARLPFLEEAHLVRLNAEDDIIQNGKALDQLEVLVHHTDVKLVCIVRVGYSDDLTIFLDRTGLRLVKTEQDAHQRRLARAVFTEQRVDLTAPELKRNIVIGLDAGELLGNVQHFNDILRFRQVHHSFDPLKERLFRIL